MKSLVQKIALAVAFASSTLGLVLADEQPARFGVSVAETGNQSGVAITKVTEGAPAMKLIRVKDGEKLTLAENRHAITHVNGQHLASPDEFVAAIAQSPRLMNLKVYDYQTKAWDEYVVELRGEPTVVVTTQPVMVYEQSASPQYQQQYYTQDDDDGDRRSGKKSGSSKKGGLFSAFNPKNYAQGDDWRPGNPVWLGQKKPTDPELRKAYNQQMFAEIVVGVAGGLEAAASASSYRPSVPSSMDSSYQNGQRSHYNHEAWKADVQMRYNTGKADWLRSLPY